VSLPMTRFQIDAAKFGGRLNATLPDFNRFD
jgi:hypothetical protein